MLISFFFRIFASQLEMFIMDRNDEISKLEHGLLFDPKELPSPLEAIRVVDDEGREWWNSRQLANTLGYGKYWNFEHLLEKVLGYMQSEKGLVAAGFVRGNSKNSN